MAVSDVIHPPAEYDSNFIKVFPFLSRRRHAALKSIREALTKDPSVFLMDWTAGVRTKAQDMALGTIHCYSSVTLETITRHFAQRDYKGIAFFFLKGDHLLPTDEMLVRALLSYHDVLEHVLSEGEIARIPWSRKWVASIFTAASSAHPGFMREDVATLEGPERDAFEALIVVYATNVTDTFAARHSMSHAMTVLVMERPDRVDDILDYQEERGLELVEMDAAAVAEYLDTPSMSLGSGVL